MDIIRKKAHVKRLLLISFDEVDRAIGLDLHFLPALAGDDFPVTERFRPFETALI